MEDLINTEICSDNEGVGFTWQNYAEMVNGCHIFITISCDPKKVYMKKVFEKMTPKEQWRFILLKFDKVLNEITKDGLRLKGYLLFPEYNKSHNIHLHGLITIASEQQYDYWTITMAKTMSPHFGNKHSIKCEFVQHYKECFDYCSKDVNKMLPLTPVIKISSF